MDLIWLLLFALLCGCMSGLLLPCDRWLSPEAIREFLGGPSHGAWHIPQAVKCDLSPERIDMTRESRSAMGRIPRGVGRLPTTR